MSQKVFEMFVARPCKGDQYEAGRMEYLVL